MATGADPPHDLQRDLRVAASVGPDGAPLVHISCSGLPRGLARACAADLAALPGGAIQPPGAAAEGRLAATLPRSSAATLASDWRAAGGLAAIGAELERALAARCGVLRFADGRVAGYRQRPLIMGILNLTPDSFYAPSRSPADQALARGMRMAEDGADIVDVGGESTRPGAESVDEGEELDRVLPAIRELIRAGAPPVSIDSRKPTVAKAALDEGAAMINDVGGLSDPAMAVLAAERGVPAVVMHMRHTPATMQERPQYDDVIGEVLRELKGRLNKAIAAGVAPDQIVVDPGIGFGKRPSDNLALLDSIGVFGMLGPVLVGASRKSFIGALLCLDVDERLAGTLAAHTAAQMRGADILRVHDVAAAAQAAAVTAAVAAAASGVTADTAPATEGLISG